MFKVFARVVRTWKYGALFPCGLVIWQSRVRCLGVACEYRGLDSSGDDFVRGAMLGLTVDTCSASVLSFGRIAHTSNVAVDSNPVAWSPFSRRMKCAQQMRQFSVLHAMRALGNLENFLFSRGWQLC